MNCISYVECSLRSAGTTSLEPIGSKLPKEIRAMIALSSLSEAVCLPCHGAMHGNSPMHPPSGLFGFLRALVSTDPLVLDQSFRREFSNKVHSLFGSLVSSPFLMMLQVSALFGCNVFLELFFFKKIPWCCKILWF